MYYILCSIASSFLGGGGGGGGGEDMLLGGISPLSYPPCMKPWYVWKRAREEIGKWGERERR